MSRVLGQFFSGVPLMLISLWSDLALKGGVMFRTTSGASRSRWSVGVWALLLSITAATLAAVLGIHTLGDNAFSGGVQAASSVTQAVSVDDPAPRDLPLAPLSVGDEATTGFADSGGVLACTLLALLCVVTLAVALMRMQGAAARTLDPLAGPDSTVPSVPDARRPAVVSLTVLGISRI